MLILKALMYPEDLTPEESQELAARHSAMGRREGLIEELWVSAMLGNLPWPGSEER